MGGPVEPSALFILHNSFELDRKESPLIPGVFVGSSADVFEQIVRSSAEGNPDLLFRIYSGCATGPPINSKGKLPGDWPSHPAEVDAIFGPNPYMVWDESDRQGVRVEPHLAPTCGQS